MARNLHDDMGMVPVPLAAPFGWVYGGNVSTSGVDRLARGDRSDWTVEERRQEAAHGLLLPNSK